MKQKYINTMQWSKSTQKNKCNEAVLRPQPAHASLVKMVLKIQNMCVKCVSNLAEKLNSGSASIPHSPPATLHWCGNHHPPHHWSKVIQLAIHQQVCLRALDKAALSNLPVHCLAVEPHHVHPEPHLLLLPLMTILSVPHKRILLVLLRLCNCFTMLPSSSVPIARTLAPVDALHTASRSHDPHHIAISVHLAAGSILFTGETGTFINQAFLPAISSSSRCVDETIFLATCLRLLETWHLMLKLDASSLDHLYAPSLALRLLLNHLPQLAGQLTARGGGAEEHGGEGFVFEQIGICPFLFIFFEYVIFVFEKWNIQFFIWKEFVICNFCIWKEFEICTFFLKK